MTAVLENINPYSKYGLKRRPTYDEIIGLIGENETLTGTLPDRTATQFKASQEGSFFDGLDHLEILKEQQNRIQERQLGELMMRQNLGGGTYNVARAREQMREGGGQAEVVDHDANFSHAQMQTELERRARDYVNRQQQTREAHRRGFLRSSASSVIDRIFDISPLSRATSGRTPQLQMPSPVRPTRADTPYSSGASGSSAELMTDGVMHTARGERTQELILNSLRFRNPNASERGLNRTLEVLMEYKDLQPEQIAVAFNNFPMLNNIYATLNRNGFISDDVFEEYQALTNKISAEGGGRKRANLLHQLADHDREFVYNPYISDMSERPVLSQFNYFKFYLILINVFG